jgi:hypothetical protein
MTSSRATLTRIAVALTALSCVLTGVGVTAPAPAYATPGAAATLPVRANVYRVTPTSFTTAGSVNVPDGTVGLLESAVVGARGNAVTVALQCFTGAGGTGPSQTCSTSSTVPQRVTINDGNGGITTVEGPFANTAPFLVVYLAYATVGSYDVTVTTTGTVVGAAGHATSRVTIDVALDTEELDAAAAGLLSLQAAGLMDACRSANSSGFLTGCGSPRADGAGYPGTSHGVTGRLCRDRYWYCGLSPSSFVTKTNIITGTHSPMSRCTTLANTPARTCDYGGQIRTSDWNLLYDSTRCGDGWTSDPNGTRIAGDKPGCMTRFDLYRALVLAVDGELSGRSIAPTSSCTDAGSFTAAQLYPILRAVHLGLPARTTANPADEASAGPYQCAPTWPARRDEAYAGIGVLLGRQLAAGDAAYTGPVLRDLADMHLGLPYQDPNGTMPMPAGVLPTFRAEFIRGAIMEGAVLPSTTECAAGGGACLESDAPLTWDTFARAMKALVRP